MAARMHLWIAAREWHPARKKPAANVEVLGVVKDEDWKYVDVVMWSEPDGQWINPDAPITDNKVNVIYWTENLELPRRIKA